MPTTDRSTKPAIGCTLELDDQRPITEAAEPKLHFTQRSDSALPFQLSGSGSGASDLMRRSETFDRMSATMGNVSRRLVSSAS